MYDPGTITIEVTATGHNVTCTACPAYLAHDVHALVAADKASTHKAAHKASTGHTLAVQVVEA